ncbi:CAP domain-containing protein [Bradyrhizobium sp. Tv2a-2]|uniref:CAP domain-containing protein n=1 Tax=Bradyrhizobium sp. Tv2a-2 TaxID=113395 RepID=UPI0004030A5D|nr:CAP domain-containing protein [Bradyrhizobium sp. Tv2a-2]
MIIRIIALLVAVSALALSVDPARAAEATAAQLISGFRHNHGEGTVTIDPTLNRIALEQARAMAGRNTLDHSVLGSFSSRIAPSRAGRAAENIAYGYDTFPKTLDQWINSSEHRKNLLLHNASRVGIASAKDASGKRTYWAMEIAGDYEENKPKSPKGRKEKEPMVAVKREVVVKREARAAPAASECHVKLLSLCF